MSMRSSSERYGEICLKNLKLLGFNCDSPLQTLLPDGTALIPAEHINAFPTPDSLTDCTFSASSSPTLNSIKCAELICYYFIVQYDVKLRDERFKNCWPVIDQRKHGKAFNKELFKIFEKIKKAEPDLCSNKLFIVKKSLLSKLNCRYFQQFLAVFSTFLLSRKLSLYPTSDCASSLDCVDAVDPFVLEKAVSTLQLKLRTDKEAHSHQLERLNSEIVSLNSAIDEAKLKITELELQTAKIIERCKLDLPLWSDISERLDDPIFLADFLESRVKALHSNYLPSSLETIDKFLIMQDNLRRFMENPVFSRTPQDKETNDILDEVYALVGKESNDDTLIGRMRHSFTMAQQFLDWVVARRKESSRKSAIGHHKYNVSVILIMSADPIAVSTNCKISGEYVASIVRMFEESIPSNVMDNRENFTKLIHRDIEDELTRFIVDVDVILDKLSTLDLTTMGGFKEGLRARRLNLMSAELSLPDETDDFVSIIGDEKVPLCDNNAGFSLRPLMSPERSALKTQIGRHVRQVSQSKLLLPSGRSRLPDPPTYIQKISPSSSAVTIPQDMPLSPRRIKACCLSHRHRTADKDGSCFRPGRAGLNETQQDHYSNGRTSIGSAQDQDWDRYSVASSTCSIMGSSASLRSGAARHPLRSPPKSMWSPKNRTSKHIEKLLPPSQRKLSSQSTPESSFAKRRPSGSDCAVHHLVSPLATASAFEENCKSSARVFNQ